MEKIRAELKRAAAPIIGAKGQGLVEYALILLLVALVVVALVRGIGTTTNSSYETINSSLEGAGK